MAHFDHSFGIEIECFLPANQSREALATAINARIGAGSCFVESYGHSTSTSWKIITDGSLGDYAHGVEVVSPVLRGAADLAKAEEVCKAIVEFGCTINRKCGFHVHVGVENASLRFWKDLISIYSIYEPVIDSMMPVSRRSSTNAYCRTMTAVSSTQIQAVTTFDQLSRLYGHGRYGKLNMQAYYRHRTVEFRQHSGTVDSNKVRNWVLICLKMVETAKQEVFQNQAFAAAPRNAARPRTKNYLVGEMLLRPEGVTSQEVMAATGWTSVSIPTHARMCGIAFTEQKTGRITRYFAVRNLSTQATAQTFANLISMDDAERSYMQSRITSFQNNITSAAA